MEYDNEEINIKLTEFQKQIELMIDQKIQNMEENLLSNLNRSIEDRFSKHTEVIEFVKNAINSGLVEVRCEKPYTHETIIPETISSYTIKEVPNRHWMHKNKK